jgi:flotillin
LTPTAAARALRRGLVQEATQTIMTTTAPLALSPRARELQGWRTGRPVEDPEKTKRWGVVSAMPSEFLVHVRGGKVRLKSSGQGASCFKLPWDSVAVVPTSLQELRFKADQITLEKIGVEVVGLAVYRIAEPLVAYRVLNFSFPERAQEKLEETLTSMFVGAARRLIANLGVEDCLQKRKAALAEELLREVQPVVGGEGRVEDTTDKGWGVVIDTIEIQEVRILSDQVFASLQAPFRASVDRRAREAQAEAEMAIATRNAACEQSIEEARIGASIAVREKQRELDVRQTEDRRQKALTEAAIQREIEENKMATEAMLRRKKAEIERAEADAHTQAAVHRQELARKEAEAELAAFDLQAAALAKRAELEKTTWSGVLERRRAEVEITALEGSARAAVALEDARALRERSEAEARKLIAQNLPALASAVGQKFGEVKITQIGSGEGSPFGSIAQAVAAVLDLARSA